jgi:ABC-type transport system involved in multi-copper enzyme maturation permease subunit
MLKEILRFEFDYRKRRAATYIYFAITFLFCFLGVTSKFISFGGVQGGQVLPNAPATLAQITIVMTFVVLGFVSSAVMGVAVLRDFEHRTESLMFSTPISKFDYLFGRFFGSFAVLVFISSGLWLGLMTGFAIGRHLPWDPSWEEKALAPFNAWHYFQPWLFFGVTNLFIQSALFFAAGTLSRKTIVLYLQAIVLLVLYEVSDTLLADVENKTLASMLDPFAVRAFDIHTQYWTPAEKNSRLADFSGVLLWNRLLWMGIAVGVLAFTYWKFSFNVVTGKRRGKKAVAEKPSEAVQPVAIPQVKQQLGGKAQLSQLWTQAVFYAKMTVREIPFVGIVLIGIINLIVSSFYFGEMYGTNSYPITGNVLGFLTGNFGLFFFIIIVFYSGELIWKERSANINLIVDAMPVRDWTSLAAKFFGLVLIYVGLLLLLILMGVLIQAANGYFRFELPLYFQTLFTETLFFMVAFTVLAFFVQVVANNKFLGYGLMIVLFIVVSSLGSMGIENPLARFNSGSLPDYSDMNRYGHYLTPFAWYKVYWFAFIALLFVLAVVSSVRGADAVLKSRLQVGKRRLTRPVLLWAVASLLLFGTTGFYIYRNTNIINEFVATEDGEKRQLAYEQTLKKYQWVPKPRIVDVNLKVDIFPETRDFTGEGYYWLKNKTDRPMREIHIQENVQDKVKTEYLTFAGGAKVKEAFKNFGYTIYQLDKPLQPGDSVKMSFKVRFETKGFVASNDNTNIVQNGTFFNNGYFPALGYMEGGEIGDDDTRRKYKLKPKERMMEQNDPRGLAQSLFGDNADYIRFEIVVSTSENQIAIAPGYLQKQWQAEGRRYYHYKMDVPMVNFYSIVSADYQVLRDKWKDVNLEIYYQKGHEFNTQDMMASMKASLAYFSENFAPFQYRQMRIMEFPRYSSFAQSFANTVPFSEGIGFIMRIANPDKDLNVPYYVTAHEVAHQWWGHQVPEANVKGNAMLSETQAQYSALMVMKKKYSPELMQKFLKYELDSYLRGRSSETKKEQPLALVEGQGYIHYRKGSLVMFALQDYIGEDKVNLALRNFLADWQYPGPDSKQKRYPTSRDLLGYFKAQTPDSLQYLITDMFETITLFENKAQQVTYAKKSDKAYEVTVSVMSEKFKADSAGNETNVSVSDWIDIGVYGKDTKGKDKLLYLKKHKITAKESKFVITVPEPPTKAGIDPINKLIDRHPDDNVKSAESGASV